jgi:hypothetical protein
MKASEEMVREAFFVDVFLMLQRLETVAQLKATTVLEMVQERFTILGPVLGRLHDEGLSTIIERSFAIMARAGILPPPPPVLNGKQVDIQYISPLAKALRAFEARSTGEALSSSAAFIELNPESADVIDTDRAIRRTWESVGAPIDFLRDEDEVDERRAARAQQQQQAAMMEMAQKGGMEGVAK